MLLEKGYIVHGIKRRSSSFNTSRIDQLYQDPHEKDQTFFLHYGDLIDSTNILKIIDQVRPDEIYNLGAQSHVAVSFETPEYTANCDALGILRILEAVKILNLTQKPKYTKLAQANYMALYRNRLRERQLLFIQEVLTQLLNYMHIGLLLTIEKLIIFLLAMESFLIMKVQEEVKLLLQEKITRGLTRFTMAWRSQFTWATLTQKGTGGMRKIMFTCNG